MSHRITPKKSLAVPESYLRQPSAKPVFWICNKLISRVRRNDHHVSCRKLELVAVLESLSTSIDDISDKRRNHAPWLRLCAGLQLEKTAGQHAQRCHGVTTENTHVAERRLAL